MLRRQIGRLLYDSARVGASAHSRSGLCGDRMLVYRCGPLSIDMVIHVGPGAFRVYHGQVIREDFNAPVKRAVVRMGEDGNEVTTDDHGQFSFSGIVSGSDDLLSVTAGESQVICNIPPLED